MSAPAPEDISAAEAASLQPAEEAVNKAFETRDKFFQLYKVEDAPRKNAIVQELQKAALALLTPLEESCRKVPKYHYLVGKAWNVLPEYNKQADSSLAQAVKMDPDMLDGWVELGECFWKKNDVDSAKRCFERAQKIQKNKRSLWALSMLLRMVPRPPEEKRRNIQESVALAKEALALDMTNGHSWFVLGNAYLASFFANLRDTSFMEQSTKAYKRALMDATESANNSDLHHNRAMLLKYQEQYGEALEAFQLAARLDPKNKAAVEQAEALESTVSKIHTAIERKGQLKAKRIGMLIASLTLEQNPILINLKDVAADPERKGELDLKVAVTLTDDSIAQIFACLDRDGNWCCLTVYNMTMDALRVGDTVTVVNPAPKTVALTLGEKQVNYTSIRIDDPTVLYANGQKLDATSVSTGMLTLEAKPE